MQSGRVYHPGIATRIGGRRRRHKISQGHSRLNIALEAQGHFRDQAAVAVILAGDPQPLAGTSTEGLVEILADLGARNALADIGGEERLHR